MKIISHRGHWIQKSEQNTIEALNDALALGWGIETDVRDRLGELVISHDPPSKDSPDIKGLFAMLGDLPGQFLALNIKSDSLAAGIKQELAKHPRFQWAAFDMSIPDMRSYLRLGLPVLTRQSEIEPDPVFCDEAAGVWLDAFTSEWYPDSLVAGYLERGKIVCMVSPELHGREHRRFWDRISRWPFLDSPELHLCTDFPKEAHALTHA